MGNITRQDVVVPQSELREGQMTGRVALFNEDGTPFSGGGGGSTAEPLLIWTAGVDHQALMFEGYVTPGSSVTVLLTAQPGYSGPLTPNNYEEILVVGSKVLIKSQSSRFADYNIRIPDVIGTISSVSIEAAEGNQFYHVQLSVDTDSPESKFMSALVVGGTFSAGVPIPVDPGAYLVVTQ